MKRLFLQLSIPFLLLGLPLVIAWQNPGLAQSANDLVQALLTLLPVLPFAALTICLFMGFRYNNGGLIYSSLLFATCFWFSSYETANTASTLKAGCFLLLPINIIIFSHQYQRRLFTSTGLLLLGLLCLEILGIITVFGHSLYENNELWHHTETAAPAFTSFLTRISCFSSEIIQPDKIQIMSILYGLSGLYILIRCIRTPDPRLTGYIGVLSGFYIAIFLENHPNLLMLNFSIIAGILIITTVEASFSMAYYDELTGLPGRRSLNEVMGNLSGTYAIAMMDIDHFKKFNDTYGHKTGDDVLRMVAAKLARITGRAKVFRYGGEEFTAVFPGKTGKEALPHIEKLREIIAKSLFKIRGRDRKKSSAKERGKNKHQNKEVSVTISIGVTNSSKQLNTPEKVIKEADKILYQAKKAGRNCSKTG